MINIHATHLSATRNESQQKCLNFTIVLETFTVIFYLFLFIQQPIDFVAGEDGLQHQLVPQKLPVGGGFGFVRRL